MKQRIRWIIFILFILTMKIPFCVASEENQFNLTDSEIVILFDSSGSMNTQDKDRAAIDAVLQAVYSIPANYQIGFVAYHTGIQLIIPFGEKLEQWEKQLENLTYSGYTNAGEGLYQAIGLFSEKEDVSRFLIMMTDGEIDMPDSQDKEDSRVLYQEMIQKAKEKGIKIYIIAVGNQWSDTEIHIFDGAEQTDGAIYWEGQSGSLSEIIKRILYDRMNFPRSTVEIAEHAGIEYSNTAESFMESTVKSGLIDFELPIPQAERVRVVLLSNDKLWQIEAKYQAKSGRVAEGQYFAAVDLTEPEEERITIHFQTSDLSGIEAYLITEYTAKVETQVTYKKVEDDSKSSFQNFAEICFYLEDQDGICLWDNDYYEGKEVFFTINGILETGVIHSGKILYSMQIDGIEKADLIIDVSTFSEHFAVTQASSIFFSLPEEPSLEPEPDYWILGVIIVLLILVLIGLLFFSFQFKHRKSAFLLAEQKTDLGGVILKENKKDGTYKNCNYTGKLNLYVVQTQFEQDIPPQTYRLFGRQSKQITLDQILNTCEIRLGKIGAEGISFYPGADRSLIIVDQSERCTVLRGMEIIKKGVGYPVYYNGKLTVTFEDSVTELEIHYKNLKPSEQEDI